MSDVPGLYRQGPLVASPFPPRPWLELRGRYGADEYLVLPHSVETHDVQRFQVFDHGGGLHQDFIGKIELDHLLDDLKNGRSFLGGGMDQSRAIRDFYGDWRHVAPMEQPEELADRLQRDIERGALAVFRFQRQPHWGIIRQNPGEAVPPASGSVATWDGRQKVVAMFRAIPGYLEGAAKAEFEAFLTPENLTIMAVFLGGIGALQAVPVADGVVDGMIAALAWWQFGWAGVLAGKDFVEAVIKANRATTHEEILLAAKLAAAALVSLGITVLLQKITEHVHEVRWEAKAEPLVEPKREVSETPASKSLYTAKREGLEPGAVSNSDVRNERMIAASGNGAQSADGYPDLPRTAAQTFDTVRPWNGDEDPGNLIRIVGSDSNPGGSFWAKAVPDSEAEWRGGYAVQNGWNGNGAFVTSDTSGLRGWIGTAAPQPSSVDGFTLPGGQEQIWLAPNSMTPSSPVPTPWNFTP